jgi:hypothetical protein
VKVPDLNDPGSLVLCPSVASLAKSARVRPRPKPEALDHLAYFIKARKGDQNYYNQCSAHEVGQRDESGSHRGDRLFVKISLDPTRV